MRPKSAGRLIYEGAVGLQKMVQELEARIAEKDALLYRQQMNGCRECPAKERRIRAMELAQAEVDKAFASIKKENDRFRCVMREILVDHRWRRGGLDPCQCTVCIKIHALLGE